MNGFYKAVIEQLAKHGYRYDRPAGGSHEMWTNGKRSQTVSKNLQSRHTANAVMKQAGINHKF